MTAAEAIRRPLVVGNWKMNLTELWCAPLIDALKGRLEPDGPEVAVAPAFTSLRAVADRISGSSIGLAAQNVHWEEKGAFTGEVSPRMLSEMGVRYVIVGHSERRTLFGETDERVQRKVAAVRRHEMVPILCVGERRQERDNDQTLTVVARQLRLGLGEFTGGAASLVVAYEPVWAIGTGNVATAEQVDEVHRMIREQLAGLLGGADVASAVRILYGGSVNADNAAELMRLPEVDGALVGGASLEADPFVSIVRATG